MKKLFTAAFAAVVGMTGVSVAPMTAVAAPVVPLIQQGDTANNLIQVQGDGRWGGSGNGDVLLRRKWRNGPRFDRDFRRGGFRRGEFRRSGFYQQGGIGYYNGHRGYREYRRGYRRHGDFWFPAGAFIAGAIIGGALAAPGPTYYEPRPVYRERYSGGSSAHVRWCYNRYRSYDAYSNTYQPYGGPRRICYSPYS